MVVWVAFFSSSFSCNRETQAGYLCISASQVCTGVPGSFYLLLCHFLGCFALVCKIKASIPAPGKGESRMECKKCIKYLIWKMHLLFLFISDQNLVIWSHLTAVRETTNLVCLGHHHMPCQNLCSGYHKSSSSLYHSATQNSTNKDERKNLLQLTHHLFKIVQDLLD